jgi:hypothetical protein
VRFSTLKNCSRLSLAIGIFASTRASLRAVFHYGPPPDVLASSLRAASEPFFAIPIGLTAETTTS